MILGPGAALSDLCCHLCVACFCTCMVYFGCPVAEYGMAAAAVVASLAMGRRVDVVPCEPDVCSTEALAVVLQVGRLCFGMALRVGRLWFGIGCDYPDGCCLVGG